MNTDARAQMGDVESRLARIWSDVLQIPEGSIDPEANFFALGGDSVLIARVADLVASTFFPDSPDDAPGIAEYFSYGTLRSFAGRLAPPSAPLPNAAEVRATDAHEGAVAIIGMSCRFPDAPDTATFWRNLRDGVHSVRPFTDDEMLAAGVAATELKHPSYVKAGVLLEGVREFDAEYFGMTAREAMLTSPEQRLLTECAEQALQDGGYGDRGAAAPVGVFAGTGFSTYLLELFAAEPGNLESSQGMALFASNTGAASRVAYLLDLVGPALTIDTACSSSLVAVHEACQAILRGECAMALAGGATVRRFGPRGYIAEPGGIFSPDGRCRPFDARANGTIGSSGAGMVLLKRLSSAIADGDVIHAVIRGTAVNNDGRAKAGFTAPSAAGQAAVIRAALGAARVEPETIQYLETHGTATSLGDVIELSALREIFGSDTPRARRMALGALKANLGHMEAAAGIAGLIKTVLILKHGQIPPAINFEQWAPALGDPSFDMSSRLTELPRSAVPSRAGVSSFGIGGTNAHAILEQAPRVVSSFDARGPELLVVSARTDTALRESCRRLAAHLNADSSASLADIAHTLRVGRKPFEHRAYVVASDRAEAARRLESAAASTVADQRIGDSDEQHVRLEAIGRAWQRGGAVDWRSLSASLSGSASRSVRRVPLPPYPFERREHWISSRLAAAGAAPRAHAAHAAHARGRLDLSDWFNVALWEQRPALQTSAPLHSSANSASECWVILGDWRELESAISGHPASAGTRVVRVTLADHTSREGNRLTIDRRDPSSIARLFETLEHEGTPVSSVIHCAEAQGTRDIDAKPDEANLQSLDNLLDLFLIQKTALRSLARLIVVTRGAYVVADEANASPARAMLTAVTQVLAKEFPKACCRTIDIAPTPGQSDHAEQQALAMLVAEIFSDCTDPLVVFRGARRWVRTYRKVSLPAATDDSSLLRPGGTYLITGGMGGIGWTLARFLARDRRARLVLTSRSPFPPRHEWPRLLETGAAEAERIREIQSLEAAGARVLTMSADVGSVEDMTRVVEHANGEFGLLNGVIHAAGVAAPAAGLSASVRESFRDVIAPKVRGTWAVHEACRSQRLDFFLCCSSIAAVLAPESWHGYTAGNAFEDAFCEAHDGRTGTRFISIGWDSWKDVGFAARPALSSRFDAAQAAAMTSAMSPEEGVQVFQRVLSNPAARWVVSTHNLSERLADARQIPPPVANARASAAAAAASISASTDSLDAIQGQLTLIWSKLLGVESLQAADDFFSRGGDSLSAAELRTEIEARFGRSPPLRDLLESPTLGDMAQLLRAMP